MTNQIASAIKQICDEKGISEQAVIDALESALAAAYRKDFGEKNQNIKVEFDILTGESRVFDVKTVVEDISPEELEAMEAKRLERLEKEQEPVEEEGEPKKRFNPKTDIMLTETKKIDKKYEIGEQIITELSVPSAYGRMAAQTAKQVIIQKLREVERNAVYDDFKSKEGTIIIGTVQRREENRILIDLGKVTAIMPDDQSIGRERYKIGDRIKAYVVSVQLTPRGPEIIVSRSHENMLREIFALEIPEIASGVIEIMAMAREAGSRAKVAVAAKQENIDPIGSCIGQRGSRIQTIIMELGGEKVDIIQYDENHEKFIANALSPAKILNISLDEESKTAKVEVAEDQFSLVIGKSGQNVRLASRLTGWKIEVAVRKGEEKVQEEVATQEADQQIEQVVSVEGEEEVEDTHESAEGKEEEVKEENKDI